MKKNHKPLVIGNWKMNPATVDLARKLFTDIKKGVNKNQAEVEVGIAAPFPFISELNRSLGASKKISLGAQDVFFEPKGAFTGEVSLSMLKSVGVSFAVIGHSERRALGESDEDIARDTAVTIKGAVTAIVCVGEKKRDPQGDYFSFIERQIVSATQGVPKSKLKQLVIAYEPIWAIGTGKTATAENIEEMRLFIEKVLADIFGRPAANKVRIIYGGSVDKDNAAEIISAGGVAGYLVGGASLRPVDFISIIKTAATYE